MLGYCALLRQDFDFAIERLIYAYELFEGADLEALAVAATAMGLKGDIEACERALVTLRDAPLRPGIASLMGAEDSLGKRLVAAVSPFVWEPHLDDLPTARALQEAFGKFFPDFVG